MHCRYRTLASAAAFCASALLACAPSAAGPSGSSGPSGAGGASPAAPQRPIVIVGRIDPPLLNDRIDRMGLGSPVTVSMAEIDDHGDPFPILAERLPKQSDDSWTVNADGTMRTIYTLRPNLTWHDGAPLTAADFAFAYRVYLEPAVPITSRLPEKLMSDVIARDDRTVEIEWSQVYINAGALVGTQLAPLPRHLLEDRFDSDPSTFAQLPFWTSEQFVSDGPYRVTRWDHGVAIYLEAFPNFALGRPKIDNIEYRAVSDGNTIVAGFLAGTINFSQYTAINVEQALVLRDQWSSTHDGEVYDRTLFGTSYMEFQHREVPGWQPALADVRVRQALAFSLNKVALADAIQHGFGGPADTGYPKGLPIYSKVDNVIAKYPYDPRRAEALFHEVGWTKGPDGAYRDGEGRPFDVEVNGPAERERDVQIVSDMWRTAGLNPSVRVVPRAQTNDVEARSGFPGVSISAGTDNTLAYYATCDQIPTAQNRYTGKNRGSYCNPELDRLYNLSLETLDPAKRDDILVQLERLYTTDVAQLPLEYQPRIAASVGISGVRPPVQGNYQWNIWEWNETATGGPQ